MSSLAALDEDGVIWLVEQLKDALLINIELHEDGVKVTQGEWSITIPDHRGVYDPETKTMDFSGGNHG